MKRIFFESRSIDLCQMKERGAIKDPNAVFLCGAAPSRIRSLPQWFFGNDAIQRLVVICRNPEKAFKTLSESFFVETAGGGLVRDGAGAYLIMMRRGMRDLPKGHLEKGETIEECALREVEEETGVSDLELGRLICVTHHTYILNGVLSMKNTSWFEMRCPSGAGLVPQTDEEIASVGWKTEAEVKACLKDAYPSIAEVLTTYNPSFCIEQ